MKESTKAIFKKHRWRVDRFIHHYIYFVFYHGYIKAAVRFVAFLDCLPWLKPLEPGFRMMYSRYHAKILSFDDTKKIFELDEDLMVISEENKKIIPFKYAHDIVFREPDYIAVIDCPCKKAFPPYESVNCCIGIGRDLAGFWLEHCDKYNARKITPDEALEIVRSFRETGHITQAFFKLATGGSTGVICNCRPESCISLKASGVTSRIREGLVQSVCSGYSVEIDKGLCSGCGTCIEYCHYNAIQLSDSSIDYKRDICMGCGLCAERCPNKALKLYRDPEKPLPLDVDSIRENLKN